MATTKGTGRATLADLLAASELGAIDLSAEVVLASDADAALQSAQVAPTSTAGELPHDAHACGIPGCRHGASHGGPSQPDRQHKLSAPCGAVIRLTDRALGLAGGYGGIKCGHGDPFMTAARRTYSRKAV